MTTPTDYIAGLSERLRKTLAGVEPDDFRGDNLAIFIASELEPSIEDETLDDSLTWKQGAVDACDRVLDAIHAHYATAIDALQADLQVKEQAIADLGRAIHKWQSERDALQARVKELEAELDDALDPTLQSFRLEDGQFSMSLAGEVVQRVALVLTTWFRESGAKNYVEIRINARDVPFESYVFNVQKIGDGGKTPHELRIEAESRALRAKQERDEAYERAAKVADKIADGLLDAAEKLQGYIGATKLAYTEADLHEQAGTAIKALVDEIRRLAGPEKEGE